MATPTTHIFEHNDTLLQVNFTRGDDGIPTFKSVFLLDASYRPVGPNLVPLLHDVMLVSEENEQGFREAETFLSHIVAELPA